MSSRDDGELVEGSNPVLPSHLVPKDRVDVSLEWEEASSSLEGAGATVCAYCHEPLLPDEPRPAVEGPAVHLECGFRMVYGSVGHQQKCCFCYGRVDRSEEGMALREAAKASLEYYLAGHPARQ